MSQHRRPGNGDNRPGDGQPTRRDLSDEPNQDQHSWGASHGPHQSRGRGGWGASYGPHQSRGRGGRGTSYGTHQDHDRDDAQGQGNTNADNRPSDGQPTRRDASDGPDQDQHSGIASHGPHQSRGRGGWGASYGPHQNRGQHNAHNQNNARGPGGQALNLPLAGFMQRILTEQQITNSSNLSALLGMMTGNAKVVSGQDMPGRGAKFAHKLGGWFVARIHNVRNIRQARGMGDGLLSSKDLDLLWRAAMSYYNAHDVGQQKMRAQFIKMMSLVNQPDDVMRAQFDRVLELVRQTDNSTSPQAASPGPASADEPEQEQPIPHPPEIAPVEPMPAEPVSMMPAPAQSALRANAASFEPAPIVTTKAKTVPQNTKNTTMEPTPAPATAPKLFAAPGNEPAPTQTVACGAVATTPPRKRGFFTDYDGMPCFR
jgi:hypothetical protein